VRRLSETGIAVMSHIGLQPQRVASTGYKAQGRNAAAAVDLIATAKECEDAGAFGLLLEAIPHAVGKAVTERVTIPTIGIGAGNACSGQVLVLTDMLASYDLAIPGEEDSFKVPKFVRLFANVGKESRRAVDEFVAAVHTRDFPTAPKETYAMPKDQMEEFTRMIKEKEEGK
jgi:3-methyl-2-oxobutanoate hydroxymethyltransferase